MRLNRLRLLTVVCIFIFWLMLRQLLSFFSGSDISRGGVMLSVQEGRVWMNEIFEEMMWDLVGQPRLLTEDFILKTENASGAEVSFFDIGDLRFGSLSRGVVGVNGSVHVERGRVWSSFYDAHNFIISSPVSLVSVTGSYSFWHEMIEENHVRIGAVLGDLPVKGVYEGSVFFDDVVVAGEVIDIKWDGVSDVSLRRMNEDDLRDPSYLNNLAADVGNRLEDSRLEGGDVNALRDASEGRFGGGGGSRGNYSGGSRPSSASVPVVSIEKTAPVIEDVVEIAEPAVIEGEVEEPVLVDVEVADELDNNTPEKKMISGVHIDDEFDGVRPLMAKWYYEPMVDGGPVYIEVRNITGPGDYVFDFPVHAKPDFLEGDTWPEGNYFVKIFYQGEMIERFEVVR